jgi:hypothetical protein
MFLAKNSPEKNFFPMKNVPTKNPAAKNFPGTIASVSGAVEQQLANHREEEDHQIASNIVFSPTSTERGLVCIIWKKI